jgi:hypothetical protein
MIHALHFARHLTEEMEESRRFQQVPWPFLEPAKLELFPLGSRGLEDLNQHGEPRCIDIGDFVKIHSQDLTACGLELPQQEHAQVWRGINCNSAGEPDLTLITAMLAYCPDVCIQRCSLHFSSPRESHKSSPERSRKEWLLLATSNNRLIRCIFRLETTETA